MKGFLKKRWHGIPIGIVSIILALMLIGGGVLAAFAVFQGTASVTIDEAFTISNTGSDGGQEFTGPGTAGNFTWEVSLYPGESKFLNVVVSNASSAPLTVVLSLGGTLPNGVTAGWSGGGVVQGNNGTRTLVLTVTSATDAETGPGVISFDISRS